MYWEFEPLSRIRLNSSTNLRAKALPDCPRLVPAPCGKTSSATFDIEEESRVYLDRSQLGPSARKTQFLTGRLSRLMATKTTMIQSTVLGNSTPRAPPPTHQIPNAISSGIILMKEGKLLSPCTPQQLLSLLFLLLHAALPPLRLCSAPPRPYRAPATQRGWIFRVEGLAWPPCPPPSRHSSSLPPPPLLHPPTPAPDAPLHERPISSSEYLHEVCQGEGGDGVPRP